MQGRRRFAPRTSSAVEVHLHEFVQVLPLQAQTRDRRMRGCPSNDGRRLLKRRRFEQQHRRRRSGSSSDTGTVTVAVVSNPLITGQMIPLTQSVFEKENPGINVKFATYTEGDLRAAIEKDVSTHSNSFNVIMIGPYEDAAVRQERLAGRPDQAVHRQRPVLRRLRPAARGRQGAVLQRRPVLGAVLRRVVDAVLQQDPAVGGGHHHARAPDLGGGRRRRGQAEQAGHGSGDLPARPGRLGRQHGRPWTR